MWIVKVECELMGFWEKFVNFCEELECMRNYVENVGMIILIGIMLWI